MAIQRLRHEQTLDEYHKVLDTLADDEPDLANVLQFAIFYEEAVQRWFEWMRKRISRVERRPQRWRGLKPAFGATHSDQP